MTDIFNITTEAEFRAKCLETFQYQYQNVEIYRKFVDFLGVDPATVNSLETIPFLPIEMFKNHTIVVADSVASLCFQSSGTTQRNLSRHWIADPGLYEKSIYESFSKFIGQPEECIFLGLLPSYLEKQNSSLIYMVDFLMKKSQHPENGYFLYNHADLLQRLEQLAQSDRKILLFGVSFALLDFLDSVKKITPEDLRLPQLTVIETGGMKGRKEEMTKDELLFILQKGFGTKRIFSEYSMTELLSQAYSLGENIYECPNWMRVLVRNTEDPMSYVEPSRNGAINIIDLANRHSCSFIATQDLGKIVTGGAGSTLGQPFQVLGRIDHSDIRGCSLLVS